MNWIKKIKKFLVESFKFVVRKLDITIEKYIMNNEYLLYIIYLFVIIYLILNVYLLKYDKLLLLLIILIVIYTLKYLKTVIFQMNKNERLITFNIIFLIINFLNIFFNVLRYLLQNIIIYIRKFIYEIILYFFNIKLNINFTLVIENVIPIISLQVCIILFNIYFFFNLKNYFLDLDKKDMEEQDFKDTWIRKYEKIYHYLINLSMINLLIIFYLKYLVGIPIFWLLEYIFIFCLFIIICFNINGLIIIIKYYWRKK